MKVLVIGFWVTNFDYNKVSETRACFHLIRHHLTEFLSIWKSSKQSHIKRH